MPAKLQFFSFIANHLQPYLTTYLTDMSMLPDRYAHVAISQC